ncbi:hypothetical protein ACTXT7_015361 [Hymenolepis weldensis]
MKLFTNFAHNFAIGAPYDESGGSVIIYHGSKDKKIGSPTQCLGCIFDENGLRPDPEKPRPADITTLRSALGLISYYSTFLPTFELL